MEILGIVPARGGSKGVPRKNIRLLAGKPLLAYTAEAALASNLLSRVILTSDSEEIIDVGARCGLEAPFVRPAELSGDDVPMLPVIRHAVDFLEAQGAYRPDYIAILQPTSPLRSAEDIDAALSKLIQSKASSIVSVVEVPHNFSPGSIMTLHDGRLIPYKEMDESRNLRQLKEKYYARNGAAIYAFSRQCLYEKNSIYGELIIPYEMSAERSIDIDTEFDFTLCDLLLRQKDKAEEQRN